MTTHETPAAAPTPGSLRIASTLAWVWGVIFILIGFSLATPLLAGDERSSGPVAVPVGFWLLAVALCYAGYGLRKGHRSAGMLAIVLGAALAVLPFVFPSMIADVGIVIGLCMVGLTLASWRHLA
jgi:hypothetical protein